MRIEKIFLKNVGPFEHETIHFQTIPNSDKKAEVHIFTGANGSGKSTILHALASAFIHKNVTSNQVEKRLHHYTRQPLIEIDLSNNEVFSFSNGENQAFTIKNTGTPTPNILKLKDYQLFQASPSQAPHKNYQIDYACFAYSSYRNFSHRSIDTIKKIEINPFHNALLFNKEIKSEVNQWLANMIAKEAIALGSNDLKKANIYRQNITNLETVLQSLLKEKIKFQLETDPVKIVLNKNGTILDFDVIPDGLKSIISWLGDLLMRLDRLSWKDNTPILERNILLFLDEIEVHLHPKWQMKILPIVQNLFPNAQIFISTHSPFVVNSVDDAWIYKLKLDNHNISACEPPILSETGKSYDYVLDEIFGVEEKFGLATEELLDKFYKFRNKILAKERVNEKDFRQLILKLKEEGMEVQQIIGHELRQIHRITQKEFAQ